MSVLLLAAGSFTPGLKAQPPRLELILHRAGAALPLQAGCHRGEIGEALALI